MTNYNQFLFDHPFLKAVVCCRREEYEQGKVKILQLNGAIYLQPINDEQIKIYLKDLNRSSLWKNIISNLELLNLARSPLFLTMLVVVDQGQVIQTVTDLFDAYIQRQLNDPTNQGIYSPWQKDPSPKKTKHYLAWLAKTMDEKNITVFLIEQLQPDWLENTKKLKTYWLIGQLVSGLTFSLVFALIGGLVGQLIGGLIFGLVTGGAIGYQFQFIVPIVLYEKIHWSWGQGLIGGLFFGVIFGLIGGLGGGLVWGSNGLLHTGLVFSLLFGLAGMLSGGFHSFQSDISKKEIPNQGVWLTLRNTATLGLIGSLAGGLLFGLSSRLTINLSSELNNGLISKPIANFIDDLILNPALGFIGSLFLSLYNGWIGSLIFGLSSGFIIGFLSAGTGVLKHIALRLTLYYYGNIPWNYARFLDHTAKHRFIQRVGGQYRFMHDLLRKHFAAMYQSCQPRIKNKIVLWLLNHILE